MSEEGYSTVMDAILFLALVCACAVILGQAVAGEATERAAADRGLRALAADTLCSLGTEQVDYFEYRVLGNVADEIAAAGGVNATEDILYKDMAKALLGRGDRHRTVLDLAAGNAACQFLIGQGDVTVRANPVTVDYDREIAALVDRAVRSSLDSRYQYEFTLRWSPLAGVPLAGEVKVGRQSPAGAVSSSVQVSMPYTTGIARPLLEKANVQDLEDIGRSLDRYGSDGDEIGLRQGLAIAITGCLKNTTALDLGEIWNNTLGATASGDGSANPLSVLKRFLDRETPGLSTTIGLNISLRDLAGGLADSYYRAEAGDMAAYIAAGIADGQLCPGDVRQVMIGWLMTRYQPSSAVATISVWTGSHA